MECADLSALFVEAATCRQWLVIRAVGPGRQVAHRKSANKLAHSIAFRPRPYRKTVPINVRLYFASAILRAGRRRERADECSQARH